MFKEKAAPELSNGLRDDADVGSPSRSDDTRVDDVAFRRATRKLDFFLLPAVTMIYFLNFLDRWAPLRIVRVLS